jgi:hypothetical protein
MELIDIAGKIEELSTTLVKLPKIIKEREIAYHTVVAEYEKNVARETLKLQSEGQPATLISTLVKGVTADDKLAVGVKEAELKCVINGMKACIEAKNGYQSRLKYLEVQ